MSSDYRDNLETLQRINQANSPAGSLPLMPDDWADTAALADELNRNMFDQLSHDDNGIAQRLAAWRVSWLWHADGQREYDNRWCPAFDEDNPSPGQLYALVYGEHANTVFPLRHLDQHRDVAVTLLDDVTSCDGHLTMECFTALPATKFLAVKRGDYVCLFKLCSSCRQALETLTVDSPEYTGIDEHWIDDRKATPRPIHRRPLED